MVGRKVRKLATSELHVDLASLPGHPGFLNSSWVQVHAGHITSADIASWPNSVGILVSGSLPLSLVPLHWPCWFW